MSDVLARICADKRAEVARRKRARGLSTLDAEARAGEAPRGFVAALREAVAGRRYGLICEIKKASPSKGLIRADFDPPAHARAYQAGGATCLSVLTDGPYFQGADAHLAAARAACALPVLRKDFTLDPYQVAEARALGAEPDAVLIPCGGGGLTAGIATAIKAELPSCRIFMVEPEGFDDTARSLAAGRRLANQPGPGTLCDALTADMPGELTFPINRALTEGALTVADAAVCEGVYGAFTEFKLVLEPSGAIALAALLSGALGEVFDPSGKTVAVVASGGNVDPGTYAEALRAGATRAAAREKI